MTTARRPRKLQYRIVIPFAIAALLALAVAALVAHVVIGRVLEARVESQVRSASAVVSRSDFALNPAILRTVKEITGADVVTYDERGEILATTIDRAGRPGLIPGIVSARGSADLDADGAAVRELVCEGLPCYAAYRPVANHPGAIVAVVVGMADVAAATLATTRTILLAAVVSVVVLIVVSQRVTDRVTRPLEQLVSFAHDVPDDVSGRRAAASDDEVGRLAGAFNQMLDRLDESKKALVRSEKLAVTGLLAARIAHDIRNPLSSMKMQAQLLKTQARSPEAITMLGAILHDIDQVESVIWDLLEVARPGGLVLRSVSINDVVEDLLTQMQPQLTHRGIRVVTDLDPSLPFVQIDAPRFKRAIVNLVLNAAEAMVRGGAINVRSTCETAGTVTLAICDEGPGIPADLRERLFDPFVSTKPEGIGLGLVNARAIVESHGGRIELAPALPSGTCARIHLPVQHG